MDISVQRKKRSKRDREIGVRLGDHIDVLKLVYDNRLLNSGQIQDAIPGSNQNILRKLQKLRVNGYLYRLKTSVYEKRIYAITNKGADAIAFYYGVDREEGGDWDTKNRELKDSYFIKHTLMIAGFRITLELAMKEYPGSEITFWEPEGSFKEFVPIKEKGRETRISINPDSWFGLQNPEDPEREFVFFLEADRSTMPHQRVLNRMKAYWRYYRMIREGEIEGDFFRVLTVTETETRKENLRKLAKEADDSKTGSKLFLFTCRDHFDIKNPKSILGPIWQIAKEDSYQRLLG
jgi:hypothetical protein